MTRVVALPQEILSRRLTASRGSTRMGKPPALLKGVLPLVVCRQLIIVKPPPPPFRIDPSSASNLAPNGPVGVNRVVTKVKAGGAAGGGERGVNPGVV